MNLSSTQRYVVQRDWGGVPVELAAGQAMTRQGFDLLSLFPELAEESRALSARMTGLLYLYRGWTRQPREVARRVLAGRLSREGLAPRIDVLDVAGQGTPEERALALRERLEAHSGVILRPAWTDVLSGAECDLLYSAGAGHLLIRDAEENGEALRMPCLCDALRVGRWDAAYLGEGRLHLQLTDRQGRGYAEVDGFGVHLEQGHAPAPVGVAQGREDDWTLPGVPGRWQASGDEYDIETETKEDHSHE